MEKHSHLRPLEGYLKGKEFHEMQRLVLRFLLGENTVDKFVDSSSKVTA